MTSLSRRAEILGTQTGRIAAPAAPRYEDRPQQVAMAEAIWRALTDASTW